MMFLPSSKIVLGNIPKLRFLYLLSFDFKIKIVSSEDLWDVAEWLMIFENEFEVKSQYRHLFRSMTYSEKKYKFIIPFWWELSKKSFNNTLKLYQKLKNAIQLYHNISLSHSIIPQTPFNNIIKIACIKISLKIITRL